ncbi:YSIRK-type signal peptide-containing protein [Ligilactobacillus salivarius]|uniref:YSIRK-type signal peptide-containing protein n=1 Tax=Ligilactobacillus salivarius TaxID=1624 RepID=UPI001F513397|nr:YSIRK-type signal peptide-containing protein [Ligilactobacillus salivarius]
MLSKKNRILATNYKQRWAIRKLTVGVVSVLLGGNNVIYQWNYCISRQFYSKKMKAFQKLRRKFQIII